MIADLHCDLLLYLENGSERSAYDPVSRCSISQMRQGNVRLQTLPIFTETALGSTERGLQQNAIFQTLPILYPNDFQILQCEEDFDCYVNKILIIKSIENASGFCEEHEPLQRGLSRLKDWMNEGLIAYISLTWNTENRFGGGIHTNIGLKEDGRSLLKTMDGRNIALDLSHASDRLAFDLLEFIDKHNLSIPVIASHSNCRQVQDIPRNLPDSLIKEIIHRKGVIGFNFLKPFLGPAHPQSICKHLDHALKLHGENHICFGADFFFEDDIPIANRRKPGEYFFDEFGHSGMFSNVLNYWKDELKISQALSNKIAFENVKTFLQQTLFNHGKHC